MEDTTQAKQREMWDRLVLLLITQPRQGWEREFDEIARREIERLSVPRAGRERSD